jgi:hypothetical protein
VILRFVQAIQLLENLEAFQSTPALPILLKRDP